ncbi:p12 [Pseudomonas phage PaP2]|uniref:hypothetical protein n=1 Tax=Pseudomonas phage PaP2 TaxID=270673 RepID=UPI00003593C0|nr:hypothetical protein PaP2_gp12 [Pseudomonas phage PaP2]AAS89598.1 p12 [Pseudomonas phage PaP2]
MQRLAIISAHESLAEEDSSFLLSSMEVHAISARLGNVAIACLSITSSRSISQRPGITEDLRKVRHVNRLNATSSRTLRTFFKRRADNNQLSIRSDDSSRDTTSLTLDGKIEAVDQFQAHILASSLVIEDHTFGKTVRVFYSENSSISRSFRSYYCRGKYHGLRKVSMGRSLSGSAANYRSHSQQWCRTIRNSTKNSPSKGLHVEFLRIQGGIKNTSINAHKYSPDYLKKYSS